MKSNLRTTTNIIDFTDFRGQQGDPNDASQRQREDSRCWEQQQPTGPAGAELGGRSLHAATAAPGTSG